MSQSAVEGDENGGGAFENTNSLQDVTMESESEDEGIQATKKRSKRMIIDDDDDDDDDENESEEADVGQTNTAELEEGDASMEDGLQETNDNASEDEGVDDEDKKSPVSKGKRPAKKTMNIDEAVTEVLRDSDHDDDAASSKSDTDRQAGNDEEESEHEEESQGPMTFDRDLFDAEDSSDGENDLDRAAGPEYDSAEDEDFEKTRDPKLLKKLKKMKGAAKKPREQKSRKCKPTKDEMLSLRSESQRLIRETHVKLPYHKPAPKTLQDFLARAQKKQEVYKGLKKGTLDIEKARIIQEKIVEPSLEKLPSVPHKRRSSHRTRDKQPLTSSQQSLPDSGIVANSLETQSQDGDLREPCEKRTDLSQFDACPLGEDELPDIEINSLSDSQRTLKGSGGDQHSQSVRKSRSAENQDSQNVSDWDEAVVVEQFDSPQPGELSQSQRIEDVESLSFKGDSQRSESVTDLVPESLESNLLDEVAEESETITPAATDKSELSAESAVTDRSERSVETALKDKIEHSAKTSKSNGEHTAEVTLTKAAERSDTPAVSCDAKQPCEEDSSLFNDFNKRLNSSSPMKSGKKDCGSDTAVTEKAPEEASQLTVKAARQKMAEELAQKGVVPSFGKGGGDFIVLDEESTDSRENQQESNIDRLVERLMHHYPKREAKKAKNVEISIIEQTGEGQKKELKLKTVTYRTEGEEELDLASIKRVKGNRLEALKLKLAVGMRKQREAAYERRQQLYRMENEEGFEEKGDDDEDGLPAEEEEAELTDGSDTDEEEEEEEMDLVEDKEDRNNPFLDDEAEDDDDDDDFDDYPQPRPVCAEIDDTKDEDVDLFQDSDRLQLRLDESEEDEEENEEREEEEKEVEEEKVDDDSEKMDGSRMFRGGSQRLMMSDIDDDDDSSQLQSAQDPTKTCDPEVARAYQAHRYSSAGNTVKDGLDMSFETLTPMTRLLQDTQPSNSSLPYTQPLEDSLSICSSPMSQILDADGYFRVPSSQPRRSARPSLLMESSQSQDGGDDHMDMLVGLCSGQFAEGSQDGGGIPASSGGFEGLFDNSSQSQDDRGSLASLFDTSSQSQNAIHRDSHSEGDSTSQLDLIAKRRSDMEQQRKGESLDATSGGGRFSLKNLESSCPGFSQPLKGKESDAGESMSEALKLCSGVFPSSDSKQLSQSQGGVVKKGVKRRLIIQDDSSDEEGEEAGSNGFLIMSDDEAAKESDKNELSGSDEENQDSETEEEAAFKGFRSKGKILQQFVEKEAELSGSEAESDEDLDLDEEDDYLEAEAGDTDQLNEDQLRDEVGRVHMKQMLDDDDRQLMRYKEMYLPDGDLHSEGGGRQRRFHWTHVGDDGSLNDMFANGSDEEKDVAEDPDEKQWRVERYEREKFLESQQQENNAADEEDDNSQFMKFGQFFMKRQVSEPASLPQQPPSLAKPKLVRSQSVMDKSSPGKFLKPKIPKRGSFLSRSKENLAKIAEITRASGRNANGTRGSRSFVFSINSSDKEEENNKEELLNSAAAKASAAAMKKKKMAAHRPPAKKKCVEPAPKPQSQNSIFKLLDK